jgi:hypothetical protein
LTVTLTCDVCDRFPLVAVTVTMPLSGVCPLPLLPPPQDEITNVKHSAMRLTSPFDRAALLLERGGARRCLHRSIPANKKLLSTSHAPEEKIDRRLSRFAMSVAAWTVSVEVPLLVTLVGFKEHVVAPSEEETVHARATVPTKLFVGAMVIVSLPDKPLLSVTLAFAVVSVKFGIVLAPLQAATNAPASTEPHPLARS